MISSPEETRTALGYCKLCGIEDFRDPDLRNVMRDVAQAGPEQADYPDGQEHRKLWEVAMTARALRDFGAVREDAEILGVGAGREATIFWLTRHVRRVFATDLYLAEDPWSEIDSGVGMLHSPEKETTLGWNPRRLVVQHMDARELRYEDESFDGIFSSSSIEHFGTVGEIRNSVEEMYRVLRPGGVAALATEYRLEGPSGIPGTALFDEADLRSVLLDGIPWELVSPLDLSISDQTLSNPVDFGAIIGQQASLRPMALAGKARDLFRTGRRQRSRSHGSAKTNAKPPAEAEFPHIVLRLGGSERLRPWVGDEQPRAWTSVHLALIKPGG